MQPNVEAFFDPVTFTYSYVVTDPMSKRCAIIDSVLDYDPAAGRTSYKNADRLIAYVRKQQLQVDWLLETHVHADHLSAAAYIKRELGGKLAIGENITMVQHTFGKLFNAGPDFPTDGSQFDHLFHDGDEFMLGTIKCSRHPYSRPHTCLHDLCDRRRSLCW